MVLPRMNNFGRIPVCGMISMYNATELPDGPKNMVAVLAKRLTLRGFIVFDFAKRYKEAAQALGSWHAEGLLRLREDVREGGVAVFPEDGQDFSELVEHARSAMQQATAAKVTEAFNKLVHAGVSKSQLRANPLKGQVWLIDEDGLAKLAAEVVDDNIKWTSAAPVEAQA